MAFACSFPIPKLLLLTWVFSSVVFVALIVTSFFALTVPCTSTALVLAWTTTSTVAVPTVSSAALAVAEVLSLWTVSAVTEAEPCSASAVPLRLTVASFLWSVMATAAAREAEPAPSAPFLTVVLAE